MKKIGFKCRMIRYLESEGLTGVKKIMQELGVVVEYKRGSGEFNLLSDGYSAVRVRVKDGDFVVKIPAAENGLERDAFFVLNPAIALGCLEEEKEEKVPKKRTTKKKKEEVVEEKKSVSPLVQMMRDTAEVMNSPEYEEAMSELRRAQAKMSKPFMESPV